MNRGLPLEALGVSVLVLIYSLVCLKLSSSLVCLLLSYREKSQYLTLFSAFTTISTLSSIIQQIYFVANWKILRQAQYDFTMKKYLLHGIAFEGSGDKWDLVLFYIQFYCYNVMTLNLLFWSISLFSRAWSISYPSLGGCHDNLALYSKIISVIWPAFIFGILQIQSLQEIPILHIISTYVTIYSCLATGSTLLILTLYQYIKTRRSIAETCNRDSLWGPYETEIVAGPENILENYSRTSSFKVWSRGKSIYDHALIIRFTTGFVIMGLFQIMIILLMIYRAQTNGIMAKSGKPDMSVKSAIIESLLFIPGVSASLVAFLIFGSTKSFPDCRDCPHRGFGRLRRELKLQNNDSNSENKTHKSEQSSL